MIRAVLAGAGIAILGTTSLAQNTAPLSPVHGVKHGGTYHLATKTWTRGGSSMMRGTHDVLYDNTCRTVWHTGLEQKTFHDDGRIPSTSSPQVTATRGCPLSVSMRNCGCSWAGREAATAQNVANRRRGFQGGVLSQGVILMFLGFGFVRRGFVGHSVGASAGLSKKDRRSGELPARG